jgi:1-acyl-sn-glycerol-3-phosphate acyltransferase
VRGAYRLVASICVPAIRFLFRPRVQGLDRVPAGPFVLCANQLSNLDGFALGYALRPRQPCWMGKAELFTPVTAPLLRALGIFPVHRGKGDRAAIDTAVAMVRAGEIVGIFPEGTRRTKGIHKTREARPHSGAARVALAAGVPVVPAAIRGTERLTRFRRWQIAFGEPVLPGPDGPGAARETTQTVWSSITRLEEALWKS